MFERFTEKAIKVIMLAQEEARRLGHNFVGTEQVLLGLIGEGTGIAAKTLKSIQITLAARLEKFNLESLASLTTTDELDLSSLGEKKTALFALIPDNDTSFNFLVSILYTQLFQQLFLRSRGGNA